jgi:hypothetical protein
MTVNVSKPAINVREKLAELDKPTGIAGEAMLRAETPQEQFNLIGAGRRNLIINGAMQVAQRGTSQTTSAYGSVDRWYIYSSGGTFTQQTSSPPEGFSHYLTCTSATGSVIVSQAIELPATGSAGVFYNGQTITISYYAKSTSAGDALHNPISFRNGITSIADLVSVESDSSDTNVLTTSWARYSKTYTIGVNPNSNNTCLVIQPRTSGAPSGDISITGIQLELGKVATPFEHRSYGEELALCQRYYQYGQTRGGIPMYDTYGFYPPTHFNTSMRSNPTVSVTATEFRPTGSGGQTPAYISSQNQLPDGFGVIVQASSSYQDQNGYGAYSWTADAEL